MEYKNLVTVQSPRRSEHPQMRTVCARPVPHLRMLHCTMGGLNGYERNVSKCVEVSSVTVSGVRYVRWKTVTLDTLVPDTLTP